jgi:hypothetical protein
VFTESHAKLFEACRKLSPQFRVCHEVVLLNMHGLPPELPVVAAYAGERPLGKVQANACTCGDPRCVEKAFEALLQSCLQLLRRSN